MLPDFSQPAFSFLALCVIRFDARSDGSPRVIFSDCRCQVRYLDAAGGEAAEEAEEARVYLVGQETTLSGVDTPAVLVFLDWQAQRERCRVGSRFRLTEGAAVVAVGSVQMVATR